MELLKFSNEIVINQSEKEAETLWKIREEIAESMGKMGYVLKYDLSIPPNKFEWFLNEIYPNREGPYNVFYGHVGDGNVHINIVLDSLEALHNEEDRIELKMFQLVKELGGSISAEHGIG
jgi:D-2-hydroxyglutarate dehydrogenase